MLDLFKDKQPLFYEQINNSIKNNKITHAYLIETNDYPESDSLILEFVKELFRIYMSDEEFSKIDNLIENDAFSDFLVIEPDGSWIKKDQILEVKEKFSTTSVENRPRIYLIKEADKLNKYAANSLLKFLEEPDGNIIAILVSSNRYRVLETLRSRCQLYTLINVNKKIEIENIELINNIIETIETKEHSSIAYLPVVLENDLRNKEFWIDAFNTMVDIYENSIRKYENINYKDYGQVLDLINNNNSLQDIINKISILFTTINNLEYNLNISMMLDKFIIEFTGR